MIEKKKSFTVDQLQRKLEQYCVYQDRCHKEIEQKMRDYQLIPRSERTYSIALNERQFFK